MRLPRLKPRTLLAKFFVASIVPLLLTSLMLFTMREAHAQIYYRNLFPPLPKFACEIEPDAYYIGSFVDTRAWVYNAESKTWGPFAIRFDSHSIGWDYQNSFLEKCVATELLNSKGIWEGDYVRECSTIPITPTLDYLFEESFALNSSASTTGINSPSISQVLNSAYVYIGDEGEKRVQGTVDEQINFRLGACDAPVDCEYYGHSGTDASAYYVGFTSAVTGELKISYDVDMPPVGVAYPNAHNSRVNLAWHNGIELSPWITPTGKGSIVAPVVAGGRGYFVVKGIQARYSGRPNSGVQFNSSVTWELPCPHPGNFRAEAKVSKQVIATLDGRYLLPVTVKVDHDTFATVQPVEVAGGNQEGTEYLAGCVLPPGKKYDIYDVEAGVQAEYKVNGKTFHLNSEHGVVKRFPAGCWEFARFMLDITPYVEAGGAANSPLTLRGYADPDPNWFYDTTVSPIASGGQYKETNEEDNVDVDVLRTVLLARSGPIDVDAPATPPNRVLASVGLTSGIVDVDLEDVQSGGTFNVTPHMLAPPSPPDNFSLLATYYDVEAPDLQFGRAVISFPYLAEEVEQENFSESSLRLLHYEHGEWKDVTSGLDMGNDVISGTVDSFSPFAIGVVNLDECKLVIDNDAGFTGAREIGLFSYVTGAMQIRVSNDVNFTTVVTQPYSTATPWTLDVTGDQVLSQTIYARVQGADGNPLCNDEVLSDSIIYDPLPPTVTVTTQTVDALSASPGTAAALISLTMNATDQAEGSGVAEMQVSDRADFIGTSWQPFTPSVAVEAAPSRTIYVRVRDGVGNVSDAASVQIISEAEEETEEEETEEEPNEETDTKSYLPLVTP